MEKIFKERVSLNWEAFKSKKVSWIFFHTFLFEIDLEMRRQETFLQKAI